MDRCASINFRCAIWYSQLAQYIRLAFRDVMVIQLSHDDVVLSIKFVSKGRQETTVPNLRYVDVISSGARMGGENYSQESRDCHPV